MMKKAVAYLLPFMEEEKARAGLGDKPRGKVLLATVKGGRPRYRQKHRRGSCSAATIIR